MSRRLELAKMYEQTLFAGDRAAVGTFVSDMICEMRDYTDSHIYEDFLTRHRSELSKFKQRWPMQS